MPALRTCFWTVFFRAVVFLAIWPSLAQFHAGEGGRLATLMSGGPFTSRQVPRGTAALTIRAGAPVISSGPTGDLLAGLAQAHVAEALAPGASLLHGFARAELPTLVAALRGITDAAPFRHMTTRGGYRMSVAMTSCGAVGWVTDGTGYRYDPLDPATGQAWPPIPDAFSLLAARAAAAGGYAGFEPDSCLVNEYAPGSRLSLHRDADERDFTQPIVSVSLGLPALFLWGGLGRGDRTTRVRLESGDVVVFGGPARLAYHGVAPLADGLDPLLGRRRINLTFRSAR